METLIARQPIFDRAQSRVGYELLYRDRVGATSAGGVNTAVMTARTLVGALTDIGMRTLVGESVAWVNFTEELLVSEGWRLLDPRRCVVEVLETVPPTLEIADAVARLREAGYTVALDDFEGGAEYEPLLAQAQIVKLDVLNREASGLAPAVNAYQKRGLRVLAERVESREQFAAMHAAGFDLFQGYYFSRPEPVMRPRLATGAVTLAQAMNLVQDEDTSDRELEWQFTQDPALTLKLLQIASAASMGAGTVESVRQALALVGRTTLHRWLAVLLATAAPMRSGADAERLRLLLERARLCEQLAPRCHPAAAGAPAFLAGLLSLLPSVLETEPEALLATVRVGPDVALAVLAHDGPLAGPLLLAQHLERGEWDAALVEAYTLGIPEDALAPVVLESARWAQDIIAAL